MEENVARPIVDVHLAHPGAFHHQVKRHEVFLDEVDQVHRVVFDGGIGLTHVKFRKAGGELRPDVPTYCGDAIRMFEAMSKEEVQRVTLEVAMLGAKGLSVTDPSIKHQLRSLPGDFSGLHLLCIEYVGFKIIDPNVDIGFDIAAEYVEARRLHQRQR